MYLGLKSNHLNNVLLCFEIKINHIINVTICLYTNSVVFVKIIPIFAIRAHLFTNTYIYECKTIPFREAFALGTLPTNV